MKAADYYKDKVLLITGSSMGIGKELAHAALLLGAKVVITGRNAQRLEKVQAEFASFSENVLIHQGDVADYRNNVELIDKIIKRFGRLDSVVTNAGLSCFGELEKMEAEVAKQIIDTNIYGSLFPVKAAISELKKTKGSILFISSLAGFNGLPGYSAYSLSKMSLTALAQSVSVELQESGVRVGIAYVGFTENDAEKKTLSPDGKWVEVPQRPRAFKVSRNKTALKLLKQIRRGTFSSTHSLLGIVNENMNRFFPKLTLYLFKRNYGRRL